MAAFFKWLLGWEPGDVSGRGDLHFRFVAEYSNYVIILLMVVLAFLVYLTVRSYRREGEAPRKAKITLAAIRVAVILLVMAILFQPAVVLRTVNSLTSSIVVLVDDSKSMSFQDSYSDANVADLKARLLQDLGPDAGKLPQTPRVDLVRKELPPVLAKLAKDHTLRFFRFSTTQPAGSGAPYTQEIGVVDMVLPENSKLEAPPGAQEQILKILSGNLTSSGHTSNPSAGVRGAMDRMQGQRVSAIVMPTDGQPTTPGASSAIGGLMDYVRELGLELYPVMVGDPTPPRHIAVTSLQAPREARRGADVELTASLAHRNMGGQGVTVKVQRRKQKEEGAWTDTPAVEQVTLDRASGDPNTGSRNLQTVVLRLKPEELGDFELRAVVEPLPEGEKETPDLFAIAPMRVVEEKIRVLLVSGDAGKEFQYLRNYFLRQQDDYLISVWQQNADANVNQSASTGMKLNELPKTLEELVGVPGDKEKPGYNVVILYDPQKTQDGFDKHFVEDLLKPFVQKHHGGLCYIAGNKHTDHVLGNDPDFAALREMMAVNIAGDTFTDISRIGESRPEAWQLRLTSYGIDHPIMRLGPSIEASEEIWGDMPGIYWSHPVLKPKPGARVLAVSGDPMRRMASRNEPLPLVAVQPYGRGSVLYIGFDETWRWMALKDGLYHRNFWGNVVRYLASLQAHRVTITTGGSRFTIGEEVTVEVEAYDESYQPLTKEKKEAVEVTMESADGKTSKKFKLPAVDDKPGQYKTTFRPDMTGKFQLTTDLGPFDANEAPVTKEIEIELPQGEFLRTEADRETLKSMAWPPDKFMDVTEVQRLLKMPSARWTSTHELPKYLWDTNLMLAMIVVLLAVEWILRKKYNMA